MRAPRTEYKNFGNHQLDFNSILHYKKVNKIIPFRGRRMRKIYSTQTDAVSLSFHIKTLASLVSGIKKSNLTYFWP